MRTKYELLVLILEVRKPLGVLDVSEDNSKMDLIEIGCDGGF
jgi:hypothetical protein